MFKINDDIVILAAPYEDVVGQTATIVDIDYSQAWPYTVELNNGRMVILTEYEMELYV